MTMNNDLLYDEEAIQKVVEDILKIIIKERLHPGENVTINQDLIISAKDTVYDDTRLKMEVEDLVRGKQDKLITGDGIAITNDDVIQIASNYSPQPITNTQLSELLR